MQLKLMGEKLSKMENALKNIHLLKTIRNYQWKNIEEPCTAHSRSAFSEEPKISLFFWWNIRKVFLVTNVVNEQKILSDLS